MGPRGEEEGCRREAVGIAKPHAQQGYRQEHAPVLPPEQRSLGEGRDPAQNKHKGEANKSVRRAMANSFIPQCDRVLGRKRDARMAAGKMLRHDYIPLEPKVDLLA